MDSGNKRPIGRVLFYGALSLTLYALVYLYEREIMHWATRGGWYFFIPVVLAFLFSFFHGGLARYFWELLGIRAKSRETKQQ